MKLTQDEINSVIDHVTAALSKLNKGSELTEEECRLVISDLESLRLSEQEEDKNLDSMNIDELLNEFNQGVDKAERLLCRMSEIISSGRVPMQEDVKSVNSVIDEMRRKYNSIYLSALAQVSEDEMPEDGCPAAEYVEAVRNSAAAMREKRLKEIVQILEKFLSVRSSDEKYDLELAPHRENAKRLIAGISSHSASDIDEIEREIVEYKVFLDMLVCDDPDSDDAMTLMESVAEYYSRRIQHGLDVGKYIPSEPNDTHDDAKGSDEETEVCESSGSSLEMSEFAKKIAESGILLDCNTNLGVFSKNINSNSEDKKTTASIFQNDIRKGFAKALKTIIYETVKKGSLSVRYMNIKHGMSEDVAIGSAEYLWRNGYLRKYTLSPHGEIYCASPRLEKSLAYHDAARIINITRKDFEEGHWKTDQRKEISTSVGCRILYWNLYCDSLQRFINMGYSSCTEETNMSAECFFTKVYTPKTDNISCELIIGALWNSTDECDDFLEGLKKVLEDKKPIKSVIFAANTRTGAMALAKTLLDESGESMDSEYIYLYSLEDEKYYDYFDGCETDAATIGLKKELEGVDTAEVNLCDSETTASVQSKESSPEKAAVTGGDERENIELEEKTDNANIPVLRDVIAGETDSASESFEENIFSLINSDALYAAVAYAKAFSLQKSEYTSFYNQLAYAVNDPMGHCIYLTDNAFNLIDKSGEFEDALVISTALRIFFSNQILYDYNIKSYYSGIKEYALLNECPKLSEILYTLMDFKDKYGKGMDAYADYRSKSKVDLDREIKALRQDARIFYDNFVVGQKKEKAKQKRFLETKKLMFSADSDFGQYIKAVVDGDNELQPLVLDFLQDNFYKRDSIIDIDTIDSDKLWDYIMFYWDKAGELMMYRRRADLMSRLRSNIISTTVKAVQLLAKWCDLVNRINDHADDEGDLAYKKVRRILMDNIETAVANLQITCAETETSEKHAAGLRVLSYTLQEILKRINGSYIEEDRKYFYVSFLLTDDVMLDEDYFPDLELHSSTVARLYPTTRILAHVNKLQKRKPTFRERLTSILNDNGDDYGAAGLILDYLKVKEPSESWSDISEAIESGEAYAKETALLRKDDFIGNLELAQSYGQFDNSLEDKKEKILQIIDEWYGWALETSNYGFFNHVMVCYLAEIKEEAKIREKDLLEQLESFKKASVPGLSAEGKEQRAARILEMINEQNYTVAEDLLAREDAYEEEQEYIIEEDFLKEFLDNYDDYYQPVSMRNASFATLISARARNKEQRGAKRLVENWLPGGSDLGSNRLRNLLNCMGFKVADIKTQTAIGKFEHFSVLTEKAKGGQRSNYTHPIAAFGSGAAMDGFRVVCINGAYDADALINIMKQIGNAMHTMILYDNALPMSERRRLARKTKSSLGDKLFAVVDRAVMMFLVRNYDETKINRMLVSLITPFGYYQPYVWESANVMPPEIFMGRKQELEKIKSPTGVNIVYGGRQLGKSALLKKAKEDIDWDENGNRAVLVDVKGLDYKKAAKKIAHELYDASVLEQDTDTEDWDELARAVRQRLQSEKNRIPYLLLLLDEADVFIDSCGAVNYHPFDALKDIQSIGAGRFKFVIAGLRNIVRFKREALDNNSVLTHLQSMTVKPFNTSEARELLEIPLHYLGLRFPKEKESLISLILATTNYFPGLIQMYCAMLVNAMRKKDYANYDEVDTPIYEVSEEHIKKVLADPEFTQQIREKYIITLKLDEDNYYYLIALLMAFLYHNNGYNEGYSASDIKNAGNELEIAKISGLDNAKLEALMEELKELNVLRKTDETRYLFTRFTFFQMMGTRAEIEDKLEEYMGE